jgi:hypothetical protein
MSVGPSHLGYFHSEDPDVITCDELPCVDVGVGIYHHPYCGMRRDDPDLLAPLTSEEEEMLPADTGAVA